MHPHSLTWGTSWLAHQVGLWPDTVASMQRSDPLVPPWELPGSPGFPEVWGPSRTPWRNRSQPWSPVAVHAACRGWKAGPAPAGASWQSRLGVSVHPRTSSSQNIPQAQGACKTPRSWGQAATPGKVRCFGNRAPTLAALRPNRLGGGGGSGWDAEQRPMGPCQGPEPAGASRTPAGGRLLTSKQVVKTRLRHNIWQLLQILLCLKSELLAAVQ